VILSLTQQRLGNSLFADMPPVEVVSPQALSFKRGDFEPLHIQFKTVSSFFKIDGVTYSDSPFCYNPAFLGCFSRTSAHYAPRFFSPLQSVFFSEAFRIFPNRVPPSGEPFLSRQKGFRSTLPVTGIFHLRRRDCSGLFLKKISLE